MSGPATAVFGGSFDPVHLGHLHVIGLVRSCTVFTTILVVPNRQNPLKTRGPGAGCEDRLQMLQRALATFGNCRVSREELDRPGPSYAIHTLESLISSNQVISRPGYILGDDLLKQLRNWYRWRDLLKTTVPVVITRDGDPSRLRESMPELPDDTVFLQNPPHPASSSLVRARIARGESPADLLPQSVNEYIEYHRIYH